jgi:hypothetical protein
MDRRTRDAVETSQAAMGSAGVKTASEPLLSKKKKPRGRRSPHEKREKIAPCEGEK